MYHSANAYSIGIEGEMSPPNIDLPSASFFEYRIKWIQMLYRPSKVGGGGGGGWALFYETTVHV